MFLVVLGDLPKSGAFYVYDRRKDDLVLVGFLIQTRGVLEAITVSDFRPTGKGVVGFHSTSWSVLHILVGKESDGSLSLGLPPQQSGGDVAEPVMNKRAYPGNDLNPALMPSTVMPIGARSSGP